MRLFVKANPFIPYSIIMDRNKIKKILKNEKLELSLHQVLFVIIDREKLEDGLKMMGNCNTHRV